MTEEVVMALQFNESHHRGCRFVFPDNELSEVLLKLRNDFQSYFDYNQDYKWMVASVLLNPTLEVFLSLHETGVDWAMKAIVTHLSVLIKSHMHLSNQKLLQEFFKAMLSKGERIQIVRIPGIEPTSAFDRPYTESNSYTDLHPAISISSTYLPGYGTRGC